MDPSQPNGMLEDDITAPPTQGGLGMIPTGLANLSSSVSRRATQPTMSMGGDDDRFDSGGHETTFSSGSASSSSLSSGGQDSEKKGGWWPFGGK